MFFSLKDELILRDGEKYQFVYGEEKEAIARDLNTQVNAHADAAGMYLSHRNFEVNTIEEAMNRIPMFINLIKHRGHKNILFVGHYNGGQSSWILDKFAGRNIDIMPPERNELQYMVDPNVALQFMPVLFQRMGYKGGMGVCKPPQERFRSVMHGVYAGNNLNPHMISCSTQYRHGMSAGDWELSHDPMPPQPLKFDAVVFLGVPKWENESFEESTVRETFAPYCTEDFEMIDLYYGAPDGGKWRGGDAKDFQTDLEVVWTNRASWDSEVSEGRPEEFDIMRRMITIF